MAKGDLTAFVDRALRGIIDQLNDGEQLPTERALAEQMGVSRSTVRNVLGRLDAEGLIWAEHGRGTYAWKTVPTSQQEGP